MFNIGFAEFVVVLLVAFLVVGPKDLPKVARWIAQQVKAIRKLFQEIKAEIGWDDIEAEFKDTKSDIKSILMEADISDELKDAGCAVQQSLGNIKDDFEEK